MTDYADLTLAEAATQIRQKALSPVEYLQALLERIDTYDAHYNAFCARRPISACGRRGRQKPRLWPAPGGAPARRALWPEGYY